MKVATEEVPIQPVIQVMKPTQPASTSTWKDAPFAILFLLHVAAIVAVMVSLGVPMLNAAASSSQAGSTGSSPSFTPQDIGTIAVVAVVLAVVSAIVAYLLLQAVLKFAKQIIAYSLWGNVVMCFVFAAAGFAGGAAVLAIVFIFFGMCGLCYVHAVKSRIPFAGANLHVAAAAVTKNWSIFPVAILVMAIKVVWVFLWAVAFIGVLGNVTTESPNPGASSAGTSCSANSECESGACDISRNSDSQKICQPFVPGQVVVAYCFMLLSLYWGVNVAKYVLHTTVAGMVATWLAAGDSQSAMSGSFRRASTTSFGSICLGAFLVAILQTLEALAKEAKKKGNGAACIAECILLILRGVLMYINRWAFVYVGMYGFPFAHAGKAVFGLFQQRGLSAIVNDDLVDTAMGALSLVSGVICALLALAYSLVGMTSTFSGANIIVPLVGFVFGAGVTLIPLSVVNSAVATVFVFFAEDPAALSRTHPDLHNDLISAWRTAHPDAMAAFVAM
ncbi:hypothetical protein H310_03510 [Aphanomyces invadans]|uniref:Choline transporter-like protein n=1 Tax=Aphanomyces invadans TaxID=157072 RepID=A0A024UHT2_9STRA|nr:hypothetical protein H310_03510 [Aphanomyces invadans]ETW05849.1 hypothetical protein H310_03510 [Aphanomyces invadans]|eukprot:XP_008865626.1 hypothetical protein H310_03510 [Aphanomyces invadans]